MKVKNLMIGQGRPKICVPVMVRGEKQAAEELRYICEEYKEAVDLIELRIDACMDILKEEKRKALLETLHTTAGEIPLLCTFRSFQEGGEQQISKEDYEALLLWVIHSGLVDLIDVEINQGEEVFTNLKEAAKAQGIFVVASCHNFQKTPAKDEMVSCLMAMERMGADIAKIAVMPRDREDVLELLHTSSIAQTCLDIPFITISMGKLGMLSRIAGGFTGSCITFGAVRQSSAPGQIDAGKLKDILETLA